MFSIPCQFSGACGHLWPVTRNEKEMYHIWAVTMRHLQTALHSSLLQSKVCVRKAKTRGQSGFDCSVTAVRSYCLREYKELGSTRKTKKKSRGSLIVSCHSITCFLHYRFEYLSEINLRKVLFRPIV